MMAGSSATLETIRVEKRDRVGVITLNRPKALNALNTQMMHEIGDALKTFDADLGVSCIVITG
jgi:enoyl-CoA hydratase